MFVITLKGQPATIEQLYKNENKLTLYLDNLDLYLAAPTKAKAIAIYLHHFGFTWKEKGARVDCLPVFIGLGNTVRVHVKGGKVETVKGLPSNVNFQIIED